MLKHILILQKVTLFILPYIFFYSFYIQINGELSPGGGFQAGAIFASALIGFELITERAIFEKYFSINLLVFIATLGALIYLSTGLISLIFASNFLDYYALLSDKLSAQNLGIFIVEIGVGLTVASVMCLIYCSFI